MKWLLLLVPCFAVSCAGSKPPESPVVWRKSPAVWLNGAQVYSNVEPLKGVGALGKSKLVYSARTADLDGPLHWQFVAEGDAAEHLSMTIESLQISTKRTRRTVNFPAEMLGGRQAFALEKIEEPKISLRDRLKMKKVEEEKEVKEPRWMATYTLPSSLQLFPKADGKVTLAAKISIETTKGTASEWVNFALLPNPKKSQSFGFRQTMIEYGGVPIE